MTNDPRAFLVDITRRLSEDYPMIAGGLMANAVDPGDPRWPWAERAADHVQRLCQGSPDRLDRMLEAFAVTSIDFLRLQARFLKTGRYACGSADRLVNDLYGSPEEMIDYLDGLALTYALWPNHAGLLKFFAEHFVPRLPNGATVVEVGPGHGLFAAHLLDTRRDLRYVGVDISTSSLDYSATSLAAAGVDSDRYDLIQANAATPELRDRMGGRQGDALICSEVLEHVDKPGALLAGIHQQVFDDAWIFLTTVANLEAVDHVYLFPDEASIDELVDAAGFEIVERLVQVLPGAEESDPLPLNFAAVARHVPRP